MCEGESQLPEGQLEEDLMAADFAVCLCCHLTYAEAIGSHTLFHILSFQKKDTPHILHPKKEKKNIKKTGEQVCFFMPCSQYLTTTSGRGNGAGQTDIVTLIVGAWFSAEGAVRNKIFFSFQQHVKLFPVQLFGMPLSDCCV